MQERILDNTYRLLEEIGRGGFGAVYRAVRIGAEGSGPVAIKLLNHNPAMNAQDYVRFQREATLMSQLVHPGTVTVHELGEDANCYYIVMEFISGPNLRDFVKGRGGRLPLPEILDVLVQAAEALEYVHQHSITHRDIKPQNILVCESRDRGEPRTQIKIVDFGVARLSTATPGGASGTSVNSTTRDNARAGNEVVGTYAYMAPEATGLTNLPIDQRSDIYSLGIVAYELLAGKTPFHEYRDDALLRAQVDAEPPPIRNVRGTDVPEILERLIRKCISKKPEERYQSMFALVCDLKRLQESLRSRGALDEFDLATKDLGLGELVNKAFVARAPIIDGALKFLRRSENKAARLSWGIVRGGIGVGKTRVLNEVRERLDAENTRYLYLRFSESEQRLPFQALGLALHDFLQICERASRDAHKRIQNDLRERLGDEGIELARLVPALRSVWQSEAPAPAPAAQPPSVAPELSRTQEMNDDEGLDMREALDRRYAAPSTRVNQAFAELFECLAREHGYLVFLFDDLHLADTSTLALFQFMIEQMNGAVHYSFLSAMRDKFPRTNLVLESFMRRLSSLKRRTMVWELTPFGRDETVAFLAALGMEEPPAEFVTFVQQKCNGIPLQLHSLIKQMLANDVLHPAPAVHARLEWSIDWERLSQIVIDFVNIEVLIASLDSLEKRDLQLMRIAAVSHDACEFEYFRIDPDFSRLEVETRLVSLVRRGIFEIIGDENAPLQRRAFVFAHEKLRSAVLNNMDAVSRRLTHFALANRIESLYRNPRREQLLSLAKHYDGAGDKVDPNVASLAFLRAVRIYIKSVEHNLAKYYIEKTLARAKEIEHEDTRLCRLREVFEAEYMIHAAQGNLVAASEVCRSLIDITFDTGKKETLQIFWAQLLLGLGRHGQAFEQAEAVLGPGLLRNRSRVAGLFTRLNLTLLGTFLYPWFVRVIARFWTVPLDKPEQSFQALALMHLAQFHGHERKLSRVMLLALRTQALTLAPSRFRAVFALLHAASLLRRGQLQEAYRMCEQVERYLDGRGIVDASRWVRALRALWLDYPMGRIERLNALFEGQKDALLPNSGLLHFESYGLRAWLRLIAPASGATSDPSQGGKKRRRKSDQTRPPGPPRASDRAHHKDGQGADLLDSHQARRILDSGENGQYTSLALFSDALRFALVDKLEPLRRATEQLKRQSSSSLVGEAYASYAFSLNALVAGRQKEALDHYIQATEKLSRARLEIVSLPVSDGLRLAVVLLPLLAVSFNARGWPWGTSLLKIMTHIDAVLMPAEGERNPRRTAVSALFRGLRLFMERQRKESFAMVGAAIAHARQQRTELIECVGLSLLGSFCAQASAPRAQEHLVEAYRLAHKHNWRLLERQVLGLGRRLKIDVEKSLDAEDAPGNSVSRERHVSLAVSHLLANMQRLSASQTSEELLAESTQIAARSLGARNGYLFLLENLGGREKFVCHAAWEDSESVQASMSESDALRWLSRTADEPVRVVCLDEEEERLARAATVLNTDAPAWENDPTLTRTRRVAGEPRPSRLSGAPASAQSEAVASAAGRPASARARASSLPTVAYGSEAPKTRPISEQPTIAPGLLQPVPSSQAPSHNTNLRSVNDLGRGQRIADARYLVLVAVMQGRSLLGWLALGRVSLSRYSSREVEQDLVLLGLNTGHLLARMRTADGSATHPRKGAPPRKPLSLSDGELPRGVTVEPMGLLSSQPSFGWRVWGIESSRMLMIQWRFTSKSREQERKLFDLLSHHVNLVVDSLRQKGEPVRLETLQLRLFSDVSTIFETVATAARFDAIDVNMVLFDAKEGRAMEGVFGEELMSFSGTSTVENEFLQEVSNVLSSDRLVYRERARRLGTMGGWLVAGAEASKGLLATFAHVDFASKYIVDRRTKQNLSLAMALGLDPGFEPPALAMFYADPDAAG